MRVTITKPNVFNSYGILMPVGSIQTVDNIFGPSLVYSLQATDTDGVLPFAQNPTFSAQPAATPPRRRLSVAAIGDSIVAQCMPQINLLTNAPAQTYANSAQWHSAYDFLSYGASRSNYSWYPFEYNAGYGGAQSPLILSACLPALVGYPTAQPDMCLVLAGTNDAGASVPIATTLANLRAMYTGLQAAGIQPIAATILPRADVPANVSALNRGIVRLAESMNLPLADFYSALVNPANGQWGLAAWTMDNIHPSPRAAALMGYALNLAIQQLVNASPRLVSALWSDGSTTQIIDPNFQTFSGVINTAPSFPNAAGWSAPATTSMSTMFNSAGVEPGSGHTMWRASPAIAGDASTPNYQGNSWSLAGNGTANTALVTGPSLAVAAGDRISLSFRLKLVTGLADATATAARMVIMNTNNGHVLAGFRYDSNLNFAYASANSAQIGSETGYDAGDFYYEYTVPPGEIAGGNFEPVLGLNNTAGNGSNTGSSITIANLRMINLTKAQIA
jgi:lysophospholipase L1-like esterase